MNKTRGNILWIDDEIEHLKPHILFLEEKGDSITKSDNGKEGIDNCKNNSFDLVLLDQYMSGAVDIRLYQTVDDQNLDLEMIIELRL